MSSHHVNTTEGLKGTHRDLHDQVFTKGQKSSALRYFDPHAETVTETDALLKGFCTVLLQGGKLVC